MTYDELRKRLGQRAEATARVLATEDGRLMLEALESVFFNGDLIGKDERATYSNLGAREVVRYLRELRDTAHRKGATRE